MSDELKQEGLMLFRRRLYDEAVTTFHTAADAYAGAGDEGGRFEMLNNIGVAQRLQRHWEPSLATLEQAREGFAGLGERVRQAQVLANVGDVYADQKQWDRAGHYYADSAGLFTEAAVTAEERWMHSQVLRAISLARLRQRRWLEALDFMQQSLEARPRLGPLGWLFRGLIGLALRLLGGG
jgi:tetratricopeptide (TPR) repeat protein